MGGQVFTQSGSGFQRLRGQMFIHFWGGQKVNFQGSEVTFQVLNYKFYYLTKYEYLKGFIFDKIRFLIYNDSVNSIHSVLFIKFLYSSEITKKNLTKLIDIDLDILLF